MENNPISDAATLASATAKPNTASPADHQNNPNSAGPLILLAEEDSANVSESNPLPRQPSRTPFTNLSQVDADLALARTLQDQERAYMMLSMNGEGSDYGSWETGSYEDEEEEEDFDQSNIHTDDDNEDEGVDGIGINDDEDAFDVHALEEGGEDNNQSIELDSNVFSSDEAYARALQDDEDRLMAARLLALTGLNDITMTAEVDETGEENGGNAQDAWEEVDPDELSYEELLALGEVVGSESRGLSAETLNSLPTATYSSVNCLPGINDSCVICRLDYEDGDTLTVLTCKHSYHSDCIVNWLKINKVCPVCSTEVLTFGNS